MRPAPAGKGHRMTSDDQPVTQAQLTAAQNHLVQAIANLISESEGRLEAFYRQETERTETKMLAAFHNRRTSRRPLDRKPACLPPTPRRAWRNCATKRVPGKPTPPAASGSG
jgi:hypothetical protein